MRPCRLRKPTARTSASALPCTWPTGSVQIFLAMIGDIISTCLEEAEDYVATAKQQIRQQRVVAWVIERMITETNRPTPAPRCQRLRERKRGNITGASHVVGCRCHRRHLAHCRVANALFYPCLRVRSARRSARQFKLQQLAGVQCARAGHLRSCSQGSRATRCLQACEMARNHARSILQARS